MEINKFIKDSNLKENDKERFHFFFKRLKENKFDRFSEKTFLFEGDPGIGKTYFADKIAREIGLPILFLGPYNLKGANQFQSLVDLFKEVRKTEECVIFIDDLTNVLEFEEYSLADSEKKIFIKLLEDVKRSEKRKFLIMTANDSFYLEESWMDRIEARMKLELPSDAIKKTYLKSAYSDVKKSRIEMIVERSIGYSFRDIDEVLRIAHTKGRGNITKKALIGAFQSYTPSKLERYKVIHDTKVKFKDIIGQDDIKNELAKIKLYLKKPRFFERTGIKRNNLFLFSGPSGTGKTFMARALAGEMGLPIVEITGRQLFGHEGPIEGISQAFELSRKLKNCIVLVDEADKVLGKEIMESDNPIMGTLNEHLDGVRGELKSILIFTTNNKLRFGNSFHDRINAVAFDYPTEKDRIEFLETKTKKVGINLEDDEFDLIVEKTSNLSFRQIERVWNNILFKIMDSGFKIKNNKITANNAEVKNAVSSVLNFVKATGYPPGIG